jgi:hypothetical protein
MANEKTITRRNNYQISTQSIAVVITCHLFCSFDKRFKDYYIICDTNEEINCCHFLITIMRFTFFLNKLSLILKSLFKLMTDIKELLFETNDFIWVNISKSGLKAVSLSTFINKPMEQIDCSLNTSFGLYIAIKSH